MTIKYTHQPYKSARKRANLTTAALAIFALVMILSIVQAYAENKLIITGLLHGGTGPNKALTDSLLRSQALSATWTLMRIITVVTFLTWIHRAYLNLRPLLNEAQHYSPVMSITWWFIPFLNLIMPYKVMKELSAGSAPDPPQTGQSKGTKRKISPLIGPWWGSFLSADLVLGAGALTAWDDFQTLDALRTLNTLTIIGDTIALLAAVLAILIVQKITSHQEEKQETISIDPKPTTAGSAPPAVQPGPSSLPTSSTSP